MLSHHPQVPSHFWVWATQRLKTDGPGPGGSLGPDPHARAMGDIPRHERLWDSLLALDVAQPIGSAC